MTAVCEDKHIKSHKLVTSIQVKHLKIPKVIKLIKCLFNKLVISINVEAFKASQSYKSELILSFIEHKEFQHYSGRYFSKRM